MKEDQETKNLTGENAHREISARLSNYPLAQQLAQEVYDFYGHYLCYSESRHLRSSIFTFKLQHAPVALQSAEIQLQLGTDHTAETLTHELLHLRLPMVGFPLGELVNIPFNLDSYAGEFLGMSQWALNLVQHEINRPSFIALGFNRNRFLSMPGEIMDYQGIYARKAREPYFSKLDFPYWCMEYLKHWCSARHGWDDHSLDQAEQALEWGSLLHPELRETLAAIRYWIEGGAFKTPHEYPQQVNFLLELMRIPKFVSWINLRLRFSEPRIPIAVRMNSSGALHFGPHLGASPDSR